MSKAITYSLNVTITCPIRVNDCDSASSLPDVTEYMESREAEREFEKVVLQALRTLDGDCTVEVTDNAIWDEV